MSKLINQFRRDEPPVPLEGPGAARGWGVDFDNDGAFMNVPRQPMRSLK